MSTPPISPAIIIDGPDGPELRRPRTPLSALAYRLHSGAGDWGSSVLRAAAEGQGSVQLAVAEGEAETFRGWVDAEGLRHLGPVPGQVVVFGWVAREGALQHRPPCVRVAARHLVEPRA